MYFLYNSFIFRKFFHSDLVREYEAKEGVELAFNAYNFLRTLANKIFYLLLVYLIPQTFDADCFGMLFILLSVGGMIMKDVVSLDRRAYNSVILMHVDPHDYAVAEINRYLLTETMTMGLALIGMSWYLEISVPILLVYLAMYLSVHLIGEVLSFYWYITNDYAGNNNPNKKWVYGGLVLTVAVMVYLLLTGKVVVTNEMCAWGGIALIPLGIAAYAVLEKDVNYNRYYRFNLSTDAFAGKKEVVVNTGRTTVNMTEMNRNIVTGKIDSRYKGYDFLFHAFLSRYRKSFTGGIVIKLVVITVIGAVLIALPFVREFEIEGEMIINAIMNQSRLLIYIVYWFAMAGKNFIVSCFMQIDRYLVNYSFFRKTNAISKNYTLRVLTATVITLIPSIYMLVIISIICLVHAVTVSIGSIAVLFLFVIVLGVFYSIYNVSAYYLMQPYGFNGEVINKAYSVVDVVIYMLVYVSFEVEFTLTGGILAAIAITLTVISAILYVAVIRKAPSSFRVR